MTSRLTAAHRRRAGFTLIELLTVIAIIGILAAILIPTVGKVRQTARRTADASNIRQIVSACQIYSNDYNGRLPGTQQTALNAKGEVVSSGGSVGSAVSIHQFAGALARNGGLNDANLWVSVSDEAALANNKPLTNVLVSTAPGSDYAAGFNVGGDTAILSFMAISGLTTNRPSTTPVVFTRGLTAAGAWSAVDPSASSPGGVYGEDGGHIAFLGGNVQWYQNTTSVNLAAYNGTQTANILQTLTTSEAVIGPTGAALAGTAGTGNAPP